MPFATASTSPIDAKGRHVIILGGGDTGADCLGTVHRQGAASVVQIEILDRPPDERPSDQPWPTMARIFKRPRPTTKVASDGSRPRRWSSSVSESVSAITVRDATTGETHSMPAHLVLIAAGFVGPELDDLALASEAIHHPARDAVGRRAVAPRPARGPAPVFACGDAVRGQSLIVWAIAEGRSAAAAIDAALMDAPSVLPAPVAPYSLSW